MQRVQIALGKLKRSRTSKSVDGDPLASAKTGADALEVWKEVVASGWLVKTGGKGHTVKNSKRRWFVLRGVFLSYYTEDPSKSVFKDREILKGQLYLVGAQVSQTSPDGDNATSFTFTSRGGKEFMISAAKDSELTLNDWHSHLQKAIERATTKFSADTFEGAWMHKKKYNTSWKKRWLLLRGNMLSYFSEIPQQQDADSIDGLKGSFDISDITEITCSNMDPEDEPQIGKRRFVIKMVIDNTRYYLSGADEEGQKLWYNRIKKQMTKIATQYNSAVRGVGVMQQYRKSIADFGSALRTSSDALRSSASAPSLRSSGGSNPSSLPGSEFDQMSQLNPLFRAMMAMEVQDSDIWEGKEWIYPVLRHFSTEVFAAAATFPTNIISITFPERSPFAIPRKSYKIDKRMPVHRIVATILKSLKLESSSVDPKNYTLQTLSGVNLNDQAPLVVYGLGSLLQNWQLKIVPKPPSRKGTATATVQPVSSQASSSEYPILVVFGDSKFVSKAQRVSLHPNTPLDTVVNKLCQAQNVKHPSKFVLQTLEGISLQSNFTLEAYGLGKRFKKWELKLVRSTHLEASAKTVPDGVKYAWVAVDESITLAESKEIIRKLDSALARTSASAKSSVAELQLQVHKVAKKNAKLERKLKRREAQLVEEREKLRALPLVSVLPSAEVRSAHQSGAQSARSTDLSSDSQPELDDVRPSEAMVDQSPGKEVAVEIPNESTGVLAQSKDDPEALGDNTLSAPHVSNPAEAPKITLSGDPIEIIESSGNKEEEFTQTKPFVNATAPVETSVANTDTEPVVSNATKVPMDEERSGAGSDSDSDEDADVDVSHPTTLEILDIEYSLTAKHEESIRMLRQRYETEIATLRAELEALRPGGAATPRQDARPRSASSSDIGSGSEKPIVEEYIPAAPAPPPAPPAPHSSSEKKRERHKKDRRNDSEHQASASAVGLSGGGIGAGVLDAISNKKFALKKVEHTNKKKRGGNDFLRDALEKRFNSMNLDDVEELDSWDDNDGAVTSWNDASAWADDVMRI